MIIPTKHLKAETSLIGIGAKIYKLLSKPKSISTLWDAVQSDKNVGTYERFLLALDFLYLLGMVDFRDGILTRVKGD